MFIYPSDASCDDIFRHVKQVWLNIKQINKASRTLDVYANWRHRSCQKCGGYIMAVTLCDGALAIGDGSTSHMTGSSYRLQGIHFG